jgi:5-methylcytosine-specific restriction protein A
VVKIPFVDRILDRITGKAPPGTGRSWFWRFARDNHLLEYPLCAVCGGTKKVVVHHIVPFHIAPDLELDPTNLITLCQGSRKSLNCHLLFGHLGNFKKVNPSCVSDSAQWAIKLGWRE